MELSFNRIRAPLRELIEEKTGRYFTTSRIHPDHLSIANLLFSVISGFSIYRGEIGLATVMLVLAFLADTFDGIIARARKISTFKGNYIDSSVDRFGEAFFLAGLYFSGIVSPAAIFLLGVSSFMATFFHMQILYRGGKYRPSVFEKGDRNVYFLLVLIPASFGQLLPFQLSIWVIVMLNIISVIQLFIRGINMPVHRLSSPSDPNETTLEDDYTYHGELYAT